MTGKWLGQQPLGQRSIERTLGVAAAWCLLLTSSGCVDIAARTAGLPIAGEAPPSAGVSVAADSASTPSAAEPPETVTVDVSDTATASSPPSFASDTEPAAAPTSVDGFPDADDVGLATDAVAD
jgi:hypothetical protein